MLKQTNAQKNLTQIREFLAGWDETLDVSEVVPVPMKAARIVGADLRYGSDIGFSYFNSKNAKESTVYMLDVSKVETARKGASLSRWEHYTILSDGSQMGILPTSLILALLDDDNYDTPITTWNRGRFFQLSRDILEMYLDKHQTREEEAFAF